MGTFINNRARHFTIAGAIVATLAIADVAHAASAPATASVSIRKPVTIARLRDMDFGRMIATATAGNVEIDPDTGGRTVSGGVIAAGGTVQTAQFRIVATPSTDVLITRNALPVLTRSGGGATMSVTLLTMNGASNPVTTPATGTFDIEVGGILAVGANQADGSYSGTFQINANYY